MQLIRLSETTAGLIEIPFTSVSSTNLQTRLTSGTLANAGITCYIKKGGIGAAVLGTGTFTTVDDTNAPGVRGYKPSSGELPAGISTLIFTGTGMEPREVTVMAVYVDPFRPAYYGTCVTGTLNTSVFTNNRPETTVNAWKNALVEFLTGVNAGYVTRIASSTGNGTVSTFNVDTTNGYTLPATPSNGDLFRIIAD